MSASLSFLFLIYFIIILSAIFHEYCHAWMANYLGDPTTKYAGRLTLNPLKHIDPLGTIILPLFLMLFFNTFLGWAKPVPYNPYNLSNQKYGSSKVAIAGPAANFFLALFFGLVLRFIAPVGFLYLALEWIVYINIFLGLFNLIPIPPLDGSKLLADLFPQSSLLRFLEQSFIGIFVAIIIAFMVLSPIAYYIFYFIVGAPFLGMAF